MNYRHEFHAGNHSEVFKHALLCLLIERFLKKPSVFFVLDTHAGAGMYDLRSPEARRTREAEDGIVKVYSKRSAVLHTYLEAVHSFNPDGLTTYLGFSLGKISRSEARLRRSLKERYHQSVRLYINRRLYIMGKRHKFQGRPDPMSRNQAALRRHAPSQARMV